MRQSTRIIKIRDSRLLVSALCSGFDGKVLGYILVRRQNRVEKWPIIIEVVSGMREVSSLNDSRLSMRYLEEWMWRFSFAFHLFRDAMLTFMILSSNSFKRWHYISFNYFHSCLVLSSNSFFQCLTTELVNLVDRSQITHSFR